MVEVPVMERERAISKHEAIVQPFLKDAFKEGAQRINPEHISEDQWFRQIMIGVIYNGSFPTLQDLADMYGFNRGHISFINKKFLERLYNNSSPEVQARYDLGQILAVRRPCSQKSKEKMSASNGGTSLRIRAQIEAGVRDRAEISDNTGISRPIIRGLARTTLRGWGISC